jgi:hypothetical protein
MKHPARYCTLLVLLILFLSHQTFPQTHISADNVSGKWLKQNSPYYIGGEIKIPHGNKLIIEQGVKVIFIGHYKLIVNGVLEAKGNEQDSLKPKISALLNIACYSMVRLRWVMIKY